MSDAVYFPAPGRPELYRLLRRRRAVLPERRAQSAPTVRAERRSGLSQCTQDAPHAPKKRHGTRRQGSDRAPNSQRLPGTTEPQQRQAEPACDPPEFAIMPTTREALWEPC